MKKCSICQQEKSLEKFPYRDKSKGILRKDCQECHNQRFRNWTANNPEKIKKIYNTYYQKNFGKICLKCKNWYKPQGDLKYCSLKCNLLGNVVKKKNGCWIWKKSKNTFGYGKSCMNAKTISSHRASYIIFKGNIPKNILVLHTCDNPSCINPEHLYLGDHKKNHQDMIERDRAPKFKKSKYSWDIIKKCWEMKNQGFTYLQIGIKKNIPWSTVAALIKKYNKFIRC